MNRSPITVHVELDASLFRDFAVYDAFRVKRRWKSPAIFAAILLVSAVICFGRSGTADQAVFLGTVLLVVGCGLPVVYFANFFKSVGEQINKLGLTRPKPVYTLTLTDDPDGILVDSEAGETARYAWDGVCGVYRAKRCTYLYVHQSRAFLLPDASVGEQAGALRELLAEQVAHGGRGA